MNISTVVTHRAGIGNYAYQLARHLPVLSPEDEWVFLGPDPKLTGELSRANARAIHGVKAGFRRILWEQSTLPLAACRERLDLLHGTDFSRPIVYPHPVVNTIHDLSPFVDPAFFPPAKRMYKRVLIPLAARGNRAVITDSEFSRQQILARFPSLEGRVFPIHLGVEMPNGHNSSSTKADPPFLLFVGTLENRKNLVSLVRAFRILKQHRKLPHRLVLAGKPGYGGKAIEAAVEASGLREAIVVRGYVTESELTSLYRSATALVYPSLYEGFGLPILEAMAHGVPVVCSNAASLPEVGGDAVEYFDPRNVEEMAAATEHVLDSPSLQAEMREKGLRRAALFTWEQCARKHIDIYRKVLAS